jgi:16S rRNA (adenine1518-N6/adenine1519-N6)-dimethyltransferase
MVCYHAKVELLETIPRTAFYPPPKISSVIVRLTPRKKVPFKVVDLSLFSDVVRILFSQRRRTLRKALRAFCKEMRIEKTECIEVIKGKLPLEKRVYEITPEEFGIISNEIAQRRLI